MARYREPLAPADVAWLRMERPRNSMTINAVITLGERMTVEHLKDLIRERILPFRRFRQRIVHIAGRPFWEEVPDFDLDLHVHRRGLPEPADDRALQEAVSELMSQRLDFSKPLWEMHLFENYASGAALVTRIHHCVADGIALVHLFLSIVDEEIDRTLDTMPPQGPSLLDFMMEAAGLTPLKPVFDLARETLNLSEEAMALGMEALFNPSRLQHLLAEGSETAQAFYRLLTYPEDPLTPFKRGLSGRRKACWTGPIDEDRVRQLKKAIYQQKGLVTTANDILLAAVAGAMRRYLEKEGVSCTRLTVKAFVPVNLRPLKEALSLGNYFGLVLLELPLYAETPFDRLQIVTQNMERLKTSKEAVVAYRILQLMGLAPAELQERGVEYFTARGSAVISNVPAPRHAVHFGGIPVERLIFWVPQSGDIGVGISIMNYRKTFHVGVTTDVRSVPDPETLVQGVEEEMEELFQTFLETPQPDSPSTSR